MAKISQTPITLPTLKSPYKEIIAIATSFVLTILFIIFPSLLVRYSWLGLIPVIAAAYSFGAGVGIAIALFRLLFPILLREMFGYPKHIFSLVLTWMFRGVLVGLALLVGYMSTLLRRLQSTSEEIHELRKIIPICAKCKKVRDDQGYWYDVEIYLREHSFGDVSHGLCPDCVKMLYPEEQSEFERRYYSKFKKCEEKAKRCRASRNHQSEITPIASLSFVIWHQFTTGARASGAVRVM